MHPTDSIGRRGPNDLGNQPHPTGEPGYNFFDALTRLFVEANAPVRYPADYFLDEVEFYAERNPENDEQIYCLTATHVPATNRLIITWNRNKADSGIKHEVRYAFRSIHEIGWQAALPAPQGTVRPADRADKNGMVYDTTELPLPGQGIVYAAIKSENSQLFSQIAIPLGWK
jgi:hypothetical protein